MTLKVALTGSIAAGKSALAQGFAERKITVIEADRITHTLLATNTPSYQMMIEHFGTAILQPDHSINRKALREIVFNNPTEKKWLEHTLHPLIEARLLKALKAASGPYVIAVIPLLVETGWQKYFDYVVSVEANADIRLDRLMQRDKISAALGRQMIQQQASPETRAHIADAIITLDSFDELDDILFSLDREWRHLIK